MKSVVDMLVHDGRYQVNVIGRIAVGVAIRHDVCVFEFRIKQITLKFAVLVGPRTEFQIVLENLKPTTR